MSLAGGLIRELESDSYIHVGVDGDNRCIFLFDQDAPDLDVSNPSYDPTIYSTSPNSDLQDGSVANYFQPNGQGQNKIYQCSFPYRSNGTPRLDFYLFTLTTSSFDHSWSVRYKIVSGFYSNLNITTPSVNTNVRLFKGDGLSLLGNLNSTRSNFSSVFEGYQNIVIKNSNLVYTRSDDGKLSDSFLLYSSWKVRASGGTSANLICRRSVVKNSTFLFHNPSFNNGNGNVNSIFESVVISYWRYENVPNPRPTNVFGIRCYFGTLTVENTSLNQGLFRYVFSNEDGSDVNPLVRENQDSISLPPEYNSEVLNDFTLNINSPHFRNGGANQSENIGNAKYGIPLYRGAADNNDGGLVSDVATGGQLANWVEGTNTFSTTVNFSVATLFSGFKLIGAEQLTQSFDYTNYDILTGVFSSVPSLPTNHDKSYGRPVIYARITIDGNTIPFTNDLPATVDGFNTSNYIPLQLDTGAQYYDNDVLIDGGNNLLYTDVQTDFVPNIIGYTKKTFREFLFSKISKNSLVSVSLIAYFHDKSEANLFQGLSVVGSQNIIRDVNLIAGTDVVSIDNVTNWKLIDDLETSNVDLVFNASTGLTIPFGFNKVYSSQGDFTLTTDEGQSTFNNLNINSEAIEVLDNGDGTVTVNITVIKPTEMPIIREKTIKVVEPCENPVLIRWRNTLGGVDRWVFEWNQQDSLNVDDNNLYQENFFKIEDQETILNYVKRTGRRQINLQAENIELQAIRGIRTVGLSDLVQLYDHVRGVYLTVTVQDTNIGAIDTKRKVGNIQFTVNLPELYTNGN